jgi:hypothetical protein
MMMAIVMERAELLKNYGVNCHTGRLNTELRSEIIIAAPTINKILTVKQQEYPIGGYVTKRLHTWRKGYLYD